MSLSFPYLARTTLKYKSPHATDLSFAKDETIRVTGPSEDDEDWLVGESLDGSKSGGFPKDFIVPIEEQDEPEARPAAAPEAGAETAAEEPAPVQTVKEEAPAAPVPASAPPPPQPEPADPPQPPAPTAMPQAAGSTSASGSNETGEPQSPSKMTLKDRLAFFAAAQNKAAPPPPPVKRKPATGGLTWSQRQKLRQEQEEKERAEREARGEETAPAAPSTPPAPEPHIPAASVSSSEDTKQGSGMSAADAASSIGAGGSLKERMAALRAGGAFGAPKEEKPVPPKPSGKVWTRPPAPPEPEPEEAEGGDEAGGEKLQAPTGEEGDHETEIGEQGEAADQTEEEKEKARRAAIAARMAKLGARGPMGMAAAAPPKPARQPTQERADALTAETAEGKSDSAPRVEEGATASQRGSEAEPEATSDSPSAPPETTSSPVNPTSPPASVPIAAVPRRAAPPRRRGGGASATPSSGPDAATDQSAELDKRVEKVGSDGAIEPPPQVMVADEEKPLAKTPEQLALEKIQEEKGRGEHGAEGATAAGIALAPSDATKSPREASKPVTVVGAIGGADSEDRGVRQVVGRDAGDIVTESENVPVQEVEEGIEEGGAEKDDIFDDAAAGRLEVTSPPADNLSKLEPAEMVPLHPPAPSGPAGDVQDEEDAPPPPPHRPGMADLPKDEVELRHERDAQGEDRDDGGDGGPPPPPRATRGGGSDRPLGPRPLPSPVKESAIPPPPVGSALVPPRDEEEEEREAAGAGDEEEDDEDVPPPPPVRDANRPPVPAVSSSQSGPEFVPSSAPPPRQQSEARSAGAPPAGASGDESPEAEEEEDAPPPPPPQRKPTMPPSIQTGAALTTDSPRSPHSAAPVSPSVTRSAALDPTSPIAPAAAGGEPVDEEDEEKTRRAGIAARMAKLGGIKFGAPPLPLKKMSTTSSDAPTSPITEKRSVQPETPMSPRDEQPDIAEPREATQEAAGPADAPEEAEETPEAESARRRATLARLRAGGALGFGMFNHGPASSEPSEDHRGLPEEATEDEETRQVPSGRPGAVPPADPVDEEGEAETPPPPPTGRPPVPSGRPSLPPPPHEEEGEEEDEADAPPPPPPSRPARHSTSDEPSSPIRSMSGVRPPVPSADRRLSGQVPPSPGRMIYSPSQSTDMHVTEEPAVMMTAEEGAADEARDLPPNRPTQGGFPPPIQTQLPSFSEPRRSMSNASRFSKTSSGPTGSPVTRQPSLGQGPLPPLPRSSSDVHPPPTPDQPQARASMGGSPAVAPSQGTGRPGYDALVHASQESGSRLARAAKAMFDQGKKAYYGDGSPAGFVLVAMESAHLARPQAGWGQLVYEQEAGSVLKRYDEPRPGDIAAFFDAKLKGRKGLHGYEQHVGSVEEPLVGVVVDFEVKNKHKVKVLQVERGVPGEVSYRLDDLKSGRAVIYRPGM